MAIRIYLFLFILCFSRYHSNGQDSVNNVRDSVEVVAYSVNAEIIVRFVNKGKSPKFMFAGYFKNRFKYNKYLVRLADGTEDKVLLSYLPLTAFVGTMTTDKIVIIDESILTPQQSSYEFLELRARDSVEVTFSKPDILSILGSGFAYSFNPRTVSGEPKRRLMSTNQRISQINLCFAVYEKADRDFLITKGIEYEPKIKKQFRKRALNYWVIEVKVPID